jgi:hypothetical protein
MKRIWIKLYLEMLDDPEFNELPEYIRWRAIALFLAAGENGDDGLLPPVKRLTWRLRLDDIKIAETLSALTQVGVVHETPDGWMVTNFAKRQEALSGKDRAYLYRQRHKDSNETSNEVVTHPSYSISYSDSESLKDKEELEKESEIETVTVTKPLRFAESSYWDTVVEILFQDRHLAPTFKQRIEACKPLRWTDHTLIISSPDPDWLTQRLTSTVRRILQPLCPGAEVMFTAVE